MVSDNLLALLKREQNAHSDFTSHTKKDADVVNRYFELLDKIFLIDQQQAMELVVKLLPGQRLGIGDERGALVQKRSVEFMVSKLDEFIFDPNHPGSRGLRIALTGAGKALDNAEQHRQTLISFILELSKKLEYLPNPITLITHGEIEARIAAGTLGDIHQPMILIRQEVVKANLAVAEYADRQDERKTAIATALSNVLRNIASPFYDAKLVQQVAEQADVISKGGEWAKLFKKSPNKALDAMKHYFSVRPQDTDREHFLFCDEAGRFLTNIQGALSHQPPDVRKKAFELASGLFDGRVSAHRRGDRLASFVLQAGQALLAEEQPVEVRQAIINAQFKVAAKFDDTNRASAELVRKRAFTAALDGILPLAKSDAVSAAEMLEFAYKNGHDRYKTRIIEIAQLFAAESTGEQSARLKVNSILVAYGEELQGKLKRAQEGTGYGFENIQRTVDTAAVNRAKNAVDGYARIYTQARLDANPILDKMLRGTVQEREAVIQYAEARFLAAAKEPVHPPDMLEASVRLMDYAQRYAGDVNKPDAWSRAVDAVWPVFTYDNSPLKNEAAAFVVSALDKIKQKPPGYEPPAQLYVDRLVQWASPATAPWLNAAQMFMDDFENRAKRYIDTGAANARQRLEPPVDERRELAINSILQGLPHARPADAHRIAEQIVASKHIIDEQKGIAKKFLDGQLTLAPQDAAAVAPSTNSVSVRFGGAAREAVAPSAGAAWKAPTRAIMALYRRIRRGKDCA